MYHEDKAPQEALTVAEKPVIARVQDPEIFPVLATLFDRINSKRVELPYNKEQFLDYVLENLHQDTFGLWIAVLPESGKVIGFAISTIWQGELSNEVRAKIELAYVDPESTSIVPLVLERVEEWARHHGAARLVIEAKRGVKALQRRYGFAVETHRLSKDLTNGQGT